MFRRLLVTVFLVPLLAIAQDPAASAAKPSQCELVTVPTWPMKLCDLVEGTGTEAGPGNKLSVNYVAWLADGKQFEESTNKRKPYKFALGQGKVIKGWEIGLIGMRVGGKRQLRIPSSMAYGMAGRPPAIPPNADLIFEVELLDLKQAEH